MHEHVHYPLFPIRIYSMDGPVAGWEQEKNQLKTYLQKKNNFYMKENK